MASEVASDRIFQRLSAADELISRLDERVSLCPFADGFSARRDFVEAVAWGWTQGAVVGLEDLVLHDQAMDVRAPGQDLWAAHAVVLARRKARSAGMELLSVEGVDWLLGRRRRPPRSGVPSREVRAATAPDGVSMLDRLLAALSALEVGESEGYEAGLSEWLGFVECLDAMSPALLRAAAMLEAWWIIDPLPRHRYVGGMLAARWLVGVGRVRSHLFGLETGLRLVGRGPGALIRTGDVARRLSFWLSVIARSAEDAIQEMQRLELARQAMVQRLVGRRAHARAGDVARLLLAYPVVTAPFIAERLDMSQHGARRSLVELGSVVKEVSGRSRFRAWRV